MSRVVNKSEFRVEVYPKRAGDFGGSFINLQRRCDE